MLPAKFEIANSRPGWESLPAQASQIEKSIFVFGWPEYWYGADALKFGFFPLVNMGYGIGLLVWP